MDAHNRKIKVIKHHDSLKEAKHRLIVFDEAQLIELRRWHLWSLDLINEKLGKSSIGNDGRKIV